MSLPHTQSCTNQILKIIQSGWTQSQIDFQPRMQKTRPPRMQKTRAPRMQKTRARTKIHMYSGVPALQLTQVMDEGVLITGGKSLPPKRMASAQQWMERGCSDVSKVAPIRRPLEFLLGDQKEKGPKILSQFVRVSTQGQSWLTLSWCYLIMWSDVLLSTEASVVAVVVAAVAWSSGCLMSRCD